MRLARIPEPFSHPDWLFELKHDGFRCLATVTSHTCVLQSRHGRTFAQWPQLAEEIAHSLRASDAILDGEIVCLDADARSNFRALLNRREWPHFLAFDLIRLEGVTLCDRPLIERKRMLKALMPRLESHLQYVDHITDRGEDFFRVACAADLEGIVGKPKRGPYFTDGERTNWLKIKNPTYSQMAGRSELFEPNEYRPRHYARARAPRFVFPHN